MDQLLQALAAPRRRDILKIVRRRERSAGEIHHALGGLTFGAVSQHLGVLEAAGLVSARREGRRRIYAVRAEGLRPLREWLDGMWEDALARLARLAEAEGASAARPKTGRGARGVSAARRRAGPPAVRRGRQR
jgi:DNA-binding transcriptional ArsR family regulator